MKQKSNGILKVTGILLIIGGGALVLLWMMAFRGMGFIAIAGRGDLNTPSEILSGVLGLASAGISLTAGILGVKNAARPEKASVCIFFGFLTMLIAVAGDVLRMTNGGGFDVLSAIVGILVPALYLAGAFQNRHRSVTA